MRKEFEPRISRMITNGGGFRLHPMRLIWPEEDLRRGSLVAARERVTEFQKPYQQFVHWSAKARGTLREKIEILYRDCQRFATEEIGKLVAEVGLEFARSEKLKLGE